MPVGGRQRVRVPIALLDDRRQVAVGQQYFDRSLSERQGIEMALVAHFPRAVGNLEGEIDDGYHDGNRADHFRDQRRNLDSLPFHHDFALVGARC